MENQTECFTTIHECFEKESVGDLLNKIPEITEELEKLKKDFQIYIDECDLDLYDLLQNCISIQEESSAFIAEVEEFKKELGEETKSDIFEAVQSYYDCAKDLEKQNYFLIIVDNVLHSGVCFKQYNEAIKENKLLVAVEMLIELRNILLNPVDGYEKLTVYNTMKTLLFGLWDDLFEKLTWEWDKLFVVKNEVAFKVETIHLSINLEKSQATNELLRALVKADVIDSKLNNFGKFLVEKVFTSIILRDCNVVVETENNLTLTIPVKNKHKPHYSVVLENLMIVFKFLHQKLNASYCFESNKTLMLVLGQFISADFADVLIKECLMETIPSSINELQDYGKITSEIEEFQSFLTSLDFFPSENFSILQYANNIDTLFAEKSCQYFLENARTIMFKDLSVSMAIGVDEIPKNAETVQEVSKETEITQIIENSLPQSLFYFPRCLISKSIQELLDLLFVMMEQSSQGSLLCCERLCLTARLALELYDAVVPLHHEKFLQTIPQYVALFHNNCFFLAHNCLTLGEKWKMSLSEKKLDFPITFLDFVPKLRVLGTKHLSSHMQLQRNQILDNIRSSDLSCINFKDTLSENAEQAVRQCLRQIQLLKNVWIGVFPTNVFTRLISCLVNMFVDEIIHRVCTVEDISAEIANQLTEIFTFVIMKIPNSFQNPGDAKSHVKSWNKLQELIFVLRSSLKEIESRWDDGSGPLANTFTVEEIRSLIKALFQNTQIRANLLSKLK